MFEGELFFGEDRICTLCWQLGKRALQRTSQHVLRIIGVSNFQNHVYAQLDDLDEVHLDSPFSEDYLVAAGDILFVRSNGNLNLVGRSLIIPSPLEPTAFFGFTIRDRILT